MATLSIAYSRAWRTMTFCRAPLLLGLLMLKTRYGFVSGVGKTANSGFQGGPIRLLSRAVGTVTSHSVSYAPVSIPCCTAVAVNPSLICTCATYWCRTVSLDWVHVGLVSRSISLLAM